MTCLVFLCLPLWSTLKLKSLKSALQSYSKWNKVIITFVIPSCLLCSCSHDLSSFTSSSCSRFFKESLCKWSYHHNESVPSEGIEPMWTLWVFLVLWIQSAQKVSFHSAGLCSFKKTRPVLLHKPRQLSTHTHTQPHTLTRTNTQTLSLPSRLFYEKRCPCVPLITHVALARSLPANCLQPVITRCWWLAPPRCSVVLWCVLVVSCTFNVCSFSLSLAQLAGYCCPSR